MTLLENSRLSTNWRGATGPITEMTEMENDDLDRMEPLRAGAKDAGVRSLRKWCRRKDARPAEILCAAAQELATKQPVDIRMADIAHRAGISKGTIYLYFKNKDELLKCLGIAVPHHHQAADSLAETVSSSCQE